MKAIRFEARTSIPAAASEVWRFHADPGALERLLPPGVRVEDPGDGVREGSVVRLRLGGRRLGMDWEAVHARVTEGVGFTDIAVSGPFPYWVHHHQVHGVGGRSVLSDVVWWVPPRWLPRVVARPLVGAMLRLMFAWRHDRTVRALARPGKPVGQLALQPTGGEPW